MKRHPCIKSSFANYVLKPLCPVVKPIFKAVFKIEVFGLENVPPEPCIVASNHRSHLDPSRPKRSISRALDICGKGGTL
jgi:1-acyl-sn-glycerol-3-phosphate acyltransferase